MCVVMYLSTHVLASAAIKWQQVRLAPIYKLQVQEWKIVDKSHTFNVYTLSNTLLQNFYLYLHMFSKNHLLITIKKGLTVKEMEAPNLFIV